MKHRLSVRPVMATLCVALSVLIASVGVDCPPDDGTAPFDPPVAPGDKAPRIQITRVDTPTGGTSVEEGDMVVIAFDADSGDIDQTATVSVFASLSPNPSLNDPTTIPIPITGGNNVIGPGTGSGEGTWDTTGVPSGSYNLFAEIDDGVNAAVRVTALSPIGVAPPGTQPATTPPDLVFLDPVANLGLSADDEITIRYIYGDTDSDVTVTLLLDKDLDPTNDNILFPGDPQDPDIIVLPSTARLISDPTFDGDPPPPDDPANPPAQPDSVQIRTNPRTLPMTSEAVFPFPGAPIPGELKEYRFVIDFTQIPPRSQPVFLRADITDGQNTVSRYAVGSITINRLVQSVVDVDELGFSLAGARFQGFSRNEQLGTSFLRVADLDRDGQEDFLIASRYGSPRQRPESGAAYLIFGRRKSPFPADTDGDGFPDGGVVDDNGDIVNFPAPPDFDNDGFSEFSNPYDSANVGRFGGVISINSVNSFFRGSIYAMPSPRFPSPCFGFSPVPTDTLDCSFPPEAERPSVPDLRDPNDPLRPTAGLTSMASVDMTQDGVLDLVFGLPFISSPADFYDDDPVNGTCDVESYFIDVSPNFDRCNGDPDDDIHRSQVDQGLVIMVDGTTDINFRFSKFVDAGMAGQFDSQGEKPTDDEGVIRNQEGSVANGMRFRGLEFTEFEITPDPDPEDFIVCPPLFTSSGLYGTTVARLPNIDNPPGNQNLSGDELMISSPGAHCGEGSIDVWLTDDYTDPDTYGGMQQSRSLPGWQAASDAEGACTDPPDPDPGEFQTTCRRETIPTPISQRITGEAQGDFFGWASSAGQFNQDGTPDILAGAPGADRPIPPLPTTSCADDPNCVEDVGVVYVVLLPQGGFGDGVVSSFTRLEITGSHQGDQFGKVQSGVQDFDGDSIADVAIAAEFYDDDTVGIDAGYVGVIFGRRDIQGTNFTPEDVGTPRMPGVRFIGVSAGALAGHDITSAGDFNGDGIGDLLVSSPGEIRSVNGQNRLGVAYLIFGGRHLDNSVFNLSQVGAPELPGIVFISRFSPDVPLVDSRGGPLNTVGRVGDTDGDGFDDIFVCATLADLVNSNAPDQRLERSGEAYLVYGNNAGSNNCTTFPNPCTP